MARKSNDSEFQQEIVIANHLLFMYNKFFHIFYFFEGYQQKGWLL